MAVGADPVKSNAVKQLKHHDTYVIIPLYNESQAIGNVIAELSSYFTNIVCVNDGSRDNTTEVLNKLPCMVVNHPINLGQGAALQTGIEYALSRGARYFITFDADGQHLAKDADKFTRFIKKTKQYDVILGSRFLKKNKSIPIFKLILLKMAVVFTNVSSKVRLTDTHNGLRAFNIKVAKNLNITISGYAHASEIIDTIGINGWNYKELPMTVRYTKYSKGRRGQPMINAVNILFDMLLKRVGN